MQKTFLSNLSLLMVLNLLIKPVYLLLIETEIQNRVGSDEYGHYSALLSLGFLLNIFLDLGINTFTSKELARRTEVAGSYFSGVMLLRFALAGIYFLLLFVAAFVLGYSGDSLVLLGWIGVNQLLAATLLYVRSNLSGLLLFKRDAVLSVLDRALLVAVLGAVLFSFKSAAYFNIFWLVAAQTGAYLLAVFTGLLFLWPHLGKLQLRWRPRLNRVILNQSIPYALLVLLMMAYYKTDTVMLERMRPDGRHQAGVYAMGYRLFEAANMLGFLFATLLLPLFSHALKAGRGAGELANHAFRLVVAGSFFVAVVCSLWSDEILHTFYDHHVEEAAVLFPILMFAFVAMMTSYVWGTLLTANGSMRSMNRVAAGALIANVALNAALIPQYGAAGSAAASLFTQIVVALAQIFLSKRHTGAAPNAATIWRAVLFLAVLLISGKLLTISPLHWLLQVGFLLAIAAVTSVSIGLLQTIQLRTLIRRSDVV